MAAALDARARPAGGRARQEARAAVHRGRGRRARGRPGSTGSSASSWRPTTPRQRSASTTTGWPRRPPTLGVGSPGSTRGTCPALARLPGRRSGRAGHACPADQGAVHRPLLPERVLVGDPYPDELAACRGGRPSASGWRPVDGAGRWPGSRRAAPRAVAGPRRPRRHRRPGRRRRVDGVLVCPQGFVSDHLEVLYDLDVEAAKVAAEVGLAFARTACVNDDPAVMAALAASVAGRRVDDAADLAVVGGGISGLAAAWRRTAGGPTWWSSTPPSGSAARCAPRRSVRCRWTRPPTPSWPGCRRRSSCARSWAWPASWSPPPPGRLTCGGTVRCGACPPSRLLGVPTDLDALAAGACCRRRGSSGRAGT